MSELHDAALKAGAWQYLQKRAGEMFAAAKEELKSALPQGDVVAGRLGEQIVAKASWTKGRQSVIVEDQDELLAWVKQHRPTEVVVAESVNAAYISSLKVVGGVVIDGQGEPVPGMAVKQGDPYLTVKGNDETPFLVSQLLSSGQLSIAGLRELES